MRACPQLSETLTVVIGPESTSIYAVITNRNDEIMQTLKTGGGMVGDIG